MTNNCFSHAVTIGMAFHSAKSLPWSWTDTLRAHLPVSARKDFDRFNQGFARLSPHQLSDDLRNWAATNPGTDHSAWAGLLAVVANTAEGQSGDPFRAFLLSVEAHLSTVAVPSAEGIELEIRRTGTPQSFSEPCLEDLLWWAGDHFVQSHGLDRIHYRFEGRSGLATVEFRAGCESLHCELRFPADAVRAQLAGRPVDLDQDGHHRISYLNAASDEFCAKLLDLSHERSTVPLVMLMEIARNT